MSLFPTTAGADIISGFTTIVTANMGTVLAVFAALFGVSWVLARLNKACIETLRRMAFNG